MPESADDRQRRVRPIWIVVAVIFGAILSPAVAATAAKIQEVLVTNTADNPVPVAAQGTTTVDGTVIVENGTTNPVPVDIGDVAPRPFEEGLVMCFLEGETSASDQVTVPQGERWEIEYASARPAFDVERVRSIELSAGGVIQFPITERPDVGDSTRFIVSESILTHAGPGDEVRGTILVSPPFDSQNCRTLYISGHAYPA